MIFIFFHYSWFIVFCHFSTVQQSDLITHIYTFFFSHYPPSCSILSDQIQFPVLDSRISLLIHSKEENQLSNFRFCVFFSFLKKMKGFLASFRKEYMLYSRNVYVYFFSRKNHEKVWQWPSLGKGNFYFSAVNLFICFVPFNFRILNFPTVCRHYFCS